MAVEHDAVHLPASRSCQSAPGYTDTHDSTCRSSSSTSALSVTPTWRATSTRRARTPGSDRRRPGDAVGRSPSAARGDGRVARAVFVPTERRRHPVDGRRGTRGSRSRAASLHDLARLRATRRARTRTTTSPNDAACSTTRVAELGLEAREQLAAASSASARGLGGSSRLGLARSSSSSANDDRLPRHARQRSADVLVLDALLQQHDALDEAPRAAAGSRARTRRPG